MRRGRVSVAIPQLVNNPNEGRKLSFTANFKTNHPLPKGYTVSFTDAEVALVFEDFWTYSFYFHTPLGTKLPTDSAALIATYFNEKWQGYLRRNLPNFERILAALYEEYDPISNYDSHEEETEGTKRSGGATVRNPNLTSSVTTDMLTWGKDGGIDPEYTDSTGFHARETTVDHYRNGFDTNVANGVHADRDVTNDNGSVTMDHTPTRDVAAIDATLHLNEAGLDRYNVNGQKTDGTVTTNTSGSDNTTDTPKNTSALDAAAGNTDTTAKYNDVHTRFYERKGNIGVTTSQQMIESELELRVYDALREFIHRFAEQNLFYWTEDIPYDMGCYDWS